MVQLRENLPRLVGVVLFDPQEVEGLEVDDVVATATVHQHLGESSVDDDRVDNEWVDAGVDDAVRVVITVESDGGAGPVEILGHCHPDRKDFLMLPLVLLRNELRRGPTLDHITTVNSRETIVILAATVVVALVFLLVILLYAETVKISLQHAAILELVVGPSLVIRVGILEHLV